VTEAKWRNKGIAPYEDSYERIDRAITPVPQPQGAIALLRHLPRYVLWQRFSG
jgi:hypothetical protein